MRRVLPFLSGSSFGVGLLLVALSSATVGCGGGGGGGAGGSSPKNLPPSIVATQVVPSPTGRPAVITIEATVRDPDGTVASVTVDLGAIGGPTTALQPSGPDRYSASAAVPVSVAPGAKTLPVTAFDDDGAFASAATNVTVLNAGPAIASAVAAPIVEAWGGTIDFTVVASDPDGTGVTVVVDLTPLGGPASSPLAATGPDTYTAAHVIPASGAGVLTGAVGVTVTATDVDGAVATATIPLTVLASGTLTATTAVLGSDRTGALTTLALGFTTENPWPADGRFVLELPAGFDASNVTLVATSGPSGSFAVTGATGRTVTLSRSGGADLPGGSAVALDFDGVRNASAAGATGPFALRTATASDTAIDSGTAGGSTLIASDLALHSLPGTEFSGLPLAILVDDVLRTVQVTGLVAGRSYSFSVREDGAPAVGLALVGAPTGTDVIDDRLFITIPPAAAPGTIAFTATTAHGGVSIALSYDPSTTAVASASRTATLATTETPPAISADGSRVAWGAVVAGRGEIVVTHLPTGESKVASSTTTSAPPFSTEGRSAISADGRFVAFWANTIGLVPGASGPHYYWSDLATGTFALASGAPSGGAGTFEGMPLGMSADGRYVAFADRFGVIYRYDAATGALAAASTSAAGVSADRSSRDPAISGDGRYVAFSSLATNLAPGVTTGTHIYRKDMTSGDLVLVSASAAGAPGNGRSTLPSVSADGRYVAFTSTSSSFGHSGQEQVYRKDMTAGAIEIASASATGVAGNFVRNHDARITPDGRYVAFASDATNFVPVTSNGNFEQIYRKDLVTGAIHGVSFTASGVDAEWQCLWPAISSDGRYVAFWTHATNLGGTSFGIFRKDLATGAIESVNAAPEGGVGYPVTVIGGPSDVSSDGRYVAFASQAGNLLAGVRFGQSYRFDRLTGDLDLITCDAAGNPLRGGLVSLSADGRFAAFQTNRPPLTGPGSSRVLRKDLVTGAVVTASADATGADIAGEAPALSADGRYVAFVVPAGVIGSDRIVRKDLVTGALEAASDPASTASFGAPQITPDGRFVVFDTGDATGGQVYRRDFQTGALELVSRDVAGNPGSGVSRDPAISDDGRFVLFRTTANNLAPGAFRQVRKDMTTGVVVPVSLGRVPGDMSGDARYVVDEASGHPTGVSARYDLATGTSEILALDHAGGNPRDASGARISGNGRVVAFLSDETDLVPGVLQSVGTGAVFVRDMGP